MLILLIVALQVVPSRADTDTHVRLSLHFEQAPLKEVMHSLENQSGYRFFYNHQAIDVTRKISIQVRNVSLTDALQILFEREPVAYQIKGDQIVLKRKKQIGAVDKLPGGSIPTWDSLPLELSSVMESVLPAVPVTGRVTTTEGEGLPGVSVVVKGSTVGTTTDGDGRFTIQVPDANAILIFSFIGYVTEEIPLNGQTGINVALVSDVKSLSEVVVVGYGTQQRKDVTGAIASVSSEQIKNQPVPSVDAALAGQLPGVYVAQTTGVPGGGLTVRVRGTGSIGAGNEPLYVIDGFPVTNTYSQGSNPLNSINPNDIESIEVLKDASATAIYGSRGSNGVVIITTKSGKTGKARIDFDVYSGWQEVAQPVDLMNASEFAGYIIDSRNNAWIDRGGDPNAPNEARNNAIYRILPALQDPSALGEGTDWQDEIFRRALLQNYQVTASGGTEKLKYLVSGGYFKQNGVVINSDFQRFAFRTNLEAELSKRIKAGINLTPSYTFSNVSDAEGHWSSGAVILSALTMAPHLPVYNPDGTYSTGLDLGNGFSSIENPVKLARERENRLGRFRLLGTAYTEINLVDNLKFKVLVGTDFQTSRQNTFTPSIVGRDGAPPPSIPVGSSSTGQTINWLTEYTLSYQKTFGQHNLDAVLGYTVQKENLESNYLSATNYPNDLVTTLNAGIINGGGSNQEQWSLLSYLGRLNYSYAGKYLLTATLRRDGSSRFGAQNKWGIFPSASAGWRLSEEAFLRPVTWLSDLKIRGSYGVTGNNFIGNYDHIGLLSDQNYVFGGSGGTVVNGLRASRVANPDLGWETNTQLDLGLEGGIWRNRVSFTADYYRKITSNLLLNVPVPTSTGYTVARQNIGKVQNTGWEFSLSTRNLVKAFTWSTDLNFSVNRNEVLALGPAGDPIYGNYQLTGSHITKIGEPLGNYFGYQVEGIFQDAEDVNASPRFPDSAPGQFKFKDVNGDGRLSVDDRTLLGNPLPDFIYGITNTLTYKGFDLNVLVQGVQGNEVLNLGRRFYANFAGTANSLREVNNRWRSPGNPGDGKTPRVNRDLAQYSSSNASANISSTHVEDGAYLRIRNVTLGYTLPERWVSKAAIRTARLYMSVQNAYTFTNYTGYNPEVSVTGANPLEPGVDYGGYPIARTYTFGCNFSF